METQKRIFINYRRDDILSTGDQLYQLLNDYYPGQVFLDTKKIKKGDIFPDVLKQAVKGSKLLLTVIGPNWDHAEYLERLHDPKDWVRQELELAISGKLPIIPILIKRSKGIPDVGKLPESLRNGVFDRNYIDLSVDHPYWPDILRSHLNDISQYTGLQPVLTNNLPLDERYKKLTFCLDRDEETRKIRASIARKIPLFAASGSEQTHFEAFVERCSLDHQDNFGGVLPGATVKPLSFNFSNYLPEQYQEEVYRRVAGALSLPVKQLQGEELFTAVRDRLQGGQKYVFWAIRRGGSAHQHSSGVSRVWWETWENLISESHNPNILVLLFTVPSWLQGLNLLARLRKGKPENLGRFPDKINKQFVDTWQDDFKVYLETSDEKTKFDPAVLQEQHQLHFKRQTLLYKDAVDKLQTLLAIAYRPNKSV